MAAGGESLQQKRLQPRMAHALARHEGIQHRQALAPGVLCTHAHARCVCRAMQECPAQKTCALIGRVHESQYDCDAPSSPPPCHSAHCRRHCRPMPCRPPPAHPGTRKPNKHFFQCAYCNKPDSELLWLDGATANHSLMDEAKTRFHVCLCAVAMTQHHAHRG